jgi:mRNA interferase RelE/StbE
MTFKLGFLPSALKEWEKLGSTLREQLKKTDRASGFA